MRIDINDLEDIVQFLQKEQTAGNNYVIFPEDDVIKNRHELICTPSVYEATEYCYENSTDVDAYSYLNIGSACQAVRDAMETGRLAGQDIIIDLQMLVSNHKHTMSAALNKNHKINMTMEQKKGGYNPENLIKLEEQMVNIGLGGVPRQDIIYILTANKSHSQAPYKTEIADYPNGMKYPVDVRLNCRLYKDWHYLNSYDLSIKNPQDGSELFKRRMRVEYGNTIPLKQAFNMAMGRAIGRNWIKTDPKDSTKKEQYFAWAVFDFKHTNKDGDCKITKSSKFNVEKAASEYSIKELENEESKDKWYNSIKRGNRQLSTIGDKRYYFQADPVFDAFKHFDEKMQPVLLSLKNKQGQSQAAQATPLQGQKNGKTQKLGKGQEQKTAEKLGVKKPAQRRSRANRIS